MDDRARRDADVRVVRAAYRVLGQGDFEAFAAMLSKQVQWQHPVGFGWPLGGTHLGPVAIVRNVLTVGREGWAEVEHLPSRYLAGPDHVLVLGQTSYHSHAGACGVSDFAHVWSVAEGEVANVQIFEDTMLATRHRQTP